jgi:hypothetical protein
MEKLMYNRLYDHLTRHKVLYDYQFGFRKKHSTVLALLEVVDNIYKNLDDRNIGCGIYLDLQKAFDTVNHEILLNKLYSYGIRGVVHQWFKSYLTNRVQFTCIVDDVSSYQEITCGVPQGSVLGPLLFLIYVNDIGNTVPNNMVKLFADDTNLFVFGNSCNLVGQNANFYVSELSKWFIANKLSLNITKTCYMMFSTKADDNIDLYFGKHPVVRVDSCRYLGIIIDNELKWTAHIKQLYSKLIKFTGIFYKLRTKLPEQILKQIYFAFVHSRLLYGVELYGNTCCTYIDKLSKLNNKLLRILQNQNLSVPVQELYSKYNTLPIAELHVQQLLVVVHKYLYHPELLPPAYMKNNYFVTNNQVHSYDTRSSKDLYIHNYSTTFGKRDIRCKAAALWNNLPPSLKEFSSERLFKQRLKKFLLFAQL